MGHIAWKLKDYLKERDIKPRTVENEAISLGYSFGRNSIYRLLKDDGPANLNRDTLVALITALRSITGRKVKVSDLIEFEE